MSDEHIQYLFKDADTDGDGVIQASDLEETIAKYLLSAN